MFGLFDANARKCLKPDNAEPAGPTPLSPEDILHALGHKVRNGDYGYIRARGAIIEPVLLDQIEPIRKEGLEGRSGATGKRPDEAGGRFHPTL